MISTDLLCSLCPTSTPQHPDSINDHFKADAKEKSKNSEAETILQYIAWPTMIFTNHSHKADIRFSCASMTPLVSPQDKPYFRVESAHASSTPVGLSLLSLTLQPISQNLWLRLHPVNSGQHCLSNMSHFTEMEEWRVCGGAGETQSMRTDCCSVSHFYYWCKERYRKTHKRAHSHRHSKERECRQLQPCIC